MLCPFRDMLLGVSLCHSFHLGTIPAIYSSRRRYRKRYANISCATLREFVSFGNIKTKKHHARWCEPCDVSLQGYAARGKLVPFVPLGHYSGYLLLAAQIPQAVCEHHLRYTPGVRPLWEQKKKNTTLGGVSLFWCTFRDSNPGPTD